MKPSIPLAVFISKLCHQYGSLSVKENLIHAKYAEKLFVYKPKDVYAIE